MISMKLFCNFIEIVLRHGCSPANLLHVFRTTFPKNTSGRLLLDITHPFTVVNKKLVNIKDWFTPNKLLLNVEKTKYSFFYKPNKKDDIPLRLPRLIVNDYEIKREESIKFLGVLLDQHL